MQLFRVRFAQDWLAGNFNGPTSKLDTTTNVSQYGHPALVPNVSFNPPTVNTGQQVRTATSTPVATLSGGNAYSQVDQTMLTAQAGDFFTFTTTAPAFTVFMTGIMASGVFHSGGVNVTSDAVRNGGLVQILDITGSPVLLATLDLGNNSVTQTIYLDGTSRTIKILHTGVFSNAIAPIGTVTALVGTSVSANWSVNVSTTQRTLALGTYKITCTTGGAAGVGKFKLSFMSPGGSFADIQTNLNPGTVYDLSTHIKGVSFVVNGTLVLNDSATLFTDKVMSDLITLSILTGSGGNSGSYTSQVFDSGAQDTQWYAAEWVQNAPLASFTLMTGNTPVPDGTWQTAVITPVAYTFLAAQYGNAALLNAARGRYAQFTATFPSGASTVLPFIRDVNMYCWVPERDPAFLGKLAVGAQWTPGPLLNAFAGTLAMQLTDTYTAAADFLSSYSIGGAVDQSLAQYGSDLGLPQYSGEPPLAYRNRLQSSFQSHPLGGSPTFIATQLAELVGGDLRVTLGGSAVASGAQTVTAQSPPMTSGAVRLVQGSAYQYTVTIPPAITVAGITNYPGLPGLPVTLAQAIITTLLNTLNPVGGRPTITFL